VFLCLCAHQAFEHGFPSSASISSIWTKRSVKHCIESLIVDFSKFLIPSSSTSSSRAAFRVKDSQALFAAAASTSELPRIHSRSQDLHKNSPLCFQHTAHDEVAAQWSTLSNVHVPSVGCRQLDGSIDRSYWVSSSFSSVVKVCYCKSVQS
jgi:hypothetical protein